MILKIKNFFNGSELVKLSKTQKIAITIIFDFLFFFILSIPVGINIWINKVDSIGFFNFYLNLTLAFLLAVLALFSLNFYKSSVRSFDTRSVTFRLITASSVCALFFSYGIKNEYYLYTFLLSFMGFYLSIILSRDFLGRFLNKTNQKSDEATTIIIYGAGAAGKQLYRSIEFDKNLKVLGFFDDSKALKNSQLFGLNVYGKFKDLLRLRNKNSEMQIYLAMPSISNLKRQEIIRKMENNKLIVKTVPGYHEVLSKSQGNLEIEDLSIEDIIPRKTTELNKLNFENRNVLVTGAGGSIGSEIVKQILIGNPAKIVLFENNEFNLYKIKSELISIKNNLGLNCEIYSALGDVKDYSRVKYILDYHKITHLYHAAAYKHVPIVEDSLNVIEGINNNIFGTETVCNAALNSSLENLVVISTDKAVRPTNYMGASKRYSELIAQAYNDLSSRLKISIVRFGNVINSSGSVIPLFRQQINKGGPVTITDKRVTRFFMTIAEASSLVLQAGEFHKGGEVFLLNMGEQIKIYDLARRLIHLSGRNVSYQNNSKDGINIVEFGLRPGEKLYEELLISGKEEATPNSKIFKSIESFSTFDELNISIKNLKNLCEKNDLEGIRTELKKYVEGFVPS